MKKPAIALIAFLFAVHLNLFAQNDSIAFIIEDAIRSRRGVTTIVYLDSSFNYYRLISELAAENVVHGRKDTVNVYLKLSRNEIKLLDAEFRKRDVFAWPDRMFENSLKVSSKSLYSLFSKRESKTLFFEAFNTDRYFMLSKPIFFRNGNFVVFRLAEDKDILIDTYKNLGGCVFADMAGLPKSQLAIIPGQGHVSLMEQTDTILKYMNGFLK